MIMEFIPRAAGNVEGKPNRAQTQQEKEEGRDAPRRKNTLLKFIMFMQPPVGQANDEQIYKNSTHNGNYWRARDALEFVMAEADDAGKKTRKQVVILHPIMNTIE